MALSVSAADPKAALDPRADELLKRMGDYLGHAQFFSVSAEVWQDIQLSSVSASRRAALSSCRCAGPTGCAPRSIQAGAIASWFTTATPSRSSIAPRISMARSTLPGPSTKPWTSQRTIWYRHAARGFHPERSAQGLDAKSHFRR